MLLFSSALLVSFNLITFTSNSCCVLCAVLLRALSVLCVGFVCVFRIRMRGVFTSLISFVLQSQAQHTLEFNSSFLLRYTASIIDHYLISSSTTHRTLHIIKVDSITFSKNEEQFKYQVGQRRIVGFISELRKWICATEQQNEFKSFSS